MIEEYFQSIQTLLQNLSLAQPPDVAYDRRSGKIGFVRGNLVFKDGSRLHFREFARAKRGQPVHRYMYAFQYMQADGSTIFRYDDADHYPHLPTAPHHKHLGEKDVIAAQAPDLAGVLKEIEAMIEFLQFRGQALQPSTLGEHTAFGIWANRPEANDPAAFSLKLRQDVEKRHRD